MLRAFPVDYSAPRVTVRREIDFSRLVFTVESVRHFFLFHSPFFFDRAPVHNPVLEKNVLCAFIISFLCLFFLSLQHSLFRIG